MQTIVKKMSILPAAHYQEERSPVSPDRHRGMEGVMVNTEILIKLILNFLKYMLFQTCLYEQSTINQQVCNSAEAISYKQLYGEITAPSS